MLHITLPQFYCPFPGEIHPQVEQVHQHTLNWALGHHLLQSDAAIQRFHRSRFAWLAARTYPRTNIEELALINDFFTWLFLLDDQFDDSNFGRELARMEQVVDGLLAVLSLTRLGKSQPSKPLQGPVAEALLELWERTRPLTTLQWQQRFAIHLRDYLDAYLWEIGNRVRGETPGVALYIEKRQDAGGMWLALDYIDLVEQINLPPEIYKSSLVQTLLLITNNVVCWQNDIVSVEKEMAHGDYSNLVLVLQKAHDCSLQDAAVLANELTTHEIRLLECFTTIIPAVLPDYQAELHKYLAGARSWIRGNLDWSLESYRYIDIEQLVEDHEPSYLEAILPDDPGA
ncbi:MAG: terpene synthase family protein [Ktedonobacteraceae bacterium]